MTKKKITLPDGRYLIYFRFDEAKDDEPDSAASAQPVSQLARDQADRNETESSLTFDF